MLTNRYLLTGLGLLIAIVLYFSFFDGDSSSSSNGLGAPVNPTEYSLQLKQAREKKDQFFKTDTDSPLTDKANFKGLSYFPADPNYRVVARLEPFADKTQKLVVRMSDGSEEVYDKFAHAIFSLKGETCKLLIVRVENTYSILFRDETSGKETYGGGRYLELSAEQLTASQALLDFNSAYNPYCAYNPTYACPLPPAENKLPIAVQAGERYH